MSERLEEIKESTLTGFDMFGEHCVTITKENYDWLIKQAERLIILERLREEDSTYYNELLTELREQNKRYRRALGWEDDDKS